MTCFAIFLPDGQPTSTWILLTASRQSSLQVTLHLWIQKGSQAPTCSDKNESLQCSCQPSSETQANLLLFCMHPHLLSHVQLFCDPMDYSLPGSSAHEILQARVLEWIAISSSRGSAQPGDRTHISWVSCIGKQILNHCTTWEALIGLRGNKGYWIALCDCKILG